MINSIFSYGGLMVCRVIRFCGVFGALLLFDGDFFLHFSYSNCILYFLYAVQTGAKEDLKCPACLDTNQQFYVLE